MKKEKELIALLRENSRRSVSDLSKILKISRATVQQGMDNLERKGIIESYTIKINPHHQQQQVSAYIMISIVSQNTPEITRQIQKLNQLDSQALMRANKTIKIYIFKVPMSLLSKI